MLKLGVTYTLSLLKYIRKGYGDSMVLTSRIAQNYEKIIKSGRYEADKMLSDLEARVEEQVKQLG